MIFEFPSMVIYDSSNSYAGSTKHKITVYHWIRHLVVDCVFTDEWVISDFFFV